MANTAKTTQYYELSFLASPDFNEEQATDFLQKIAKKIGKIEKTEGPKKIELAYPVKKKNEAFLMTLEFETDKEKVPTLKADIEKMPEIIRLLLISKKPVKEAPARTKEKLKPDEAETTKETPTAVRPAKKTKAQSKAKLDELEQDLEKILGISNEDEPKAKSE